MSKFRDVYKIDYNNKTIHFYKSEITLKEVHELLGDIIRKLLKSHRA